MGWFHEAEYTPQYLPSPKTRPVGAVPGENGGPLPPRPMNCK